MPNRSRSRSRAATAPLTAKTKMPAKSRKSKKVRSGMVQGFLRLDVGSGFLAGWPSLGRFQWRHPVARYLAPNLVVDGVPPGWSAPQGFPSNNGVEPAVPVIHRVPGLPFAARSSVSLRLRWTFSPQTEAGGRQVSL